MGTADAIAQPGAANPEEQRQCRKCKEIKNVRPETWPYRNPGKGKPYRPYGLVCLACEKKRKAEYEARREHVMSLTEAPKEEAAPAEEKRSDIVKETKLDVARALKAGGKTINEIAPSVLARLLEWFEDEEHPEHRWAVQFLADRILPRKLYEELGSSAAGLGTIADKRPTVLIQVVNAQPDAQPAGRVIEGSGHVELVESLPAPKPEGASE